MRPLVLTYRCSSRSERREYHTISVEDGKVMCSCVGTHWCSHIHATLVDGERNMVPFIEWDTVDQAQRLLCGKIQPPEGWKAHWRNDKIWRGIAQRRPSPMDKALSAGKPTICFIGEGALGTRSDYIEEAIDLGWYVLENPHRLLTLMVCNPRRIRTRKAETAISLGLPMLAFADWDNYAYDFTETIIDALDTYRSSPENICSSRKAA